MLRLTNLLIFFIVLPFILIFIEYILCKKNSTLALFFPLVVACFFLLLGWFAVVFSAILYGVYFAMKHLEKEKQEKKSQIDKMNIQDL